MGTLVTFPGRAGDLLWACASVRAVSHTLGEAVDLQVAGEFASLSPLLKAQPYIDHVYADARWSLTPPNEWDSPAYGSYDRVLKIGYRGWPKVPLPHVTYSTLAQQWPDTLPALPPLDLQTPWITAATGLVAAAECRATEIVVAFTEEWFELKVGLLALLTRRWAARQWTTIMIPGGRWETELGLPGCDWATAAARLACTQVCLTDCSAPHVLAVALGVSVVIVEPSEARRNPIFYPLGTGGPQVTLVRGHDGEATFDARAVAEAVERTLERVR